MSEIIKKIFWKYFLIYIPVIVGIIMYLGGFVNLFSSVLLFLGGYFAVKNTFDYRLVKKNIDGCMVVQNKNINRDEIGDEKTVKCVYRKRSRSNIRIRKK